MGTQSRRGGFKWHNPRFFAGRKKMKKKKKKHKKKRRREDKDKGTTLGAINQGAARQEEKWRGKGKKKKGARRGGFGHGR